MSDEFNEEDVAFPVLTKWSSARIYDYTTQIADYETLEELGGAINAARMGLFRITDKINQYDRLEKEARIKYDRAYRRAYITSAEKTETQKKVRAELSCELIENELLVAEQLKNELIRMSHSLRQELQTLQTIGNNIRQQMKME